MGKFITKDFMLIEKLLLFKINATLNLRMLEMRQNKSWKS